jgi:hypothetical protein
VSTILNETKAAARRAGMNIDQLQHIDVHHIVQDLLCKEQKFTFNECRRTRGRCTDIRIIFDHDDVRIDPEVDIHAGLTNFVLSRNHAASPDRRRAIDFFDKSSAVGRALDLKTLINKGVMKRTLVICSSGIVNSTTEQTSFSIYGIAENIHIQPVKVRFFAHDPSEVVMESDTSYDLGRFTHKWRDSEQGAEISSQFTCIEPTAVKATFRAEIEFTIVQQCNPNAFFTITSFGLLPVLFTDKDSSTWTTESFNVTIICKPGYWFRLKEKLKIDISMDQANEFIESLKLLARMKTRLGKTEDLKQLTDELNREANDAYEALRMELRSLGLDPNRKTDIETLPSSAELEAIISNLRNLSFLDPEIIKNSRLEAILEAGKQKAKKFDKHATYSSLAGNAQDHNGILGHMFEEMTAGKIKYAASLKGIELERIAGDGKGFINGEITTPEYADLIFRDQNGHYHAYQLKFTDSADNLKKLVEKFYETHGSNTKQYPTGLELENIKIIVPDGVPVKPVEVKIKDSSGKQITKTVNPSSDIKMGDIKLKSPSKSETAEHLKNSFDEIKKSTKMFDNLTEKLRKINVKGKKVVSRGHEIDTLTKNIKKFSQTVGGLQGEKRSELEKSISKMNHNLEKL